MYRCEHGIDIETSKCWKCDERVAITFARSLSSLSNEEFHKAMAEWDRDRG